MNKKTIPLGEATRIINHGPCVLISAADNERDNLFTVAWNMPLKKSPALVAFESATSHFTFPLIEHSGEFCISVPTAAIAEQVLKAGRVSGAAIPDKFAAAGLTREPSEKIRAPRVAEAAAHLECRVQKITVFEGSALIIGEVLCAAADESSFSNGTWQFDNGLRLLHHLGGSAFCVSEKKILL